MKKLAMFVMAIMCAAALFAERRDNINLPFVDDQSVLGKWTSVDFVCKTEDFKPGQRQWQGDLYLKDLTFLPGGKMPQPWWTWTKGVIMHSGDQTAAKYEIKKLSDGKEYMFWEWKSGDYTIRYEDPCYYVLTKDQDAVKKAVELATAKVVKKDNIDIPFVADDKLVGYWMSVDFVGEIKDFNPEDLKWKDDLYIKDIAFMPEGKTSYPGFRWTNGYVISPADSTAARYIIKSMDGNTYLFMQWKSGDYVFKRVGDIKVDNITLPFKDDKRVLGEWKSVDFVKNISDFQPGIKSWKEDLYLQKLTFEPKGKMPQPWATWTKGVVMHHGDHTASAYEIKKLDDGKEYMFFEWKSGDYVFRGQKPMYYVLTR